MLLCPHHCHQHPRAPPAWWEPSRGCSWELELSSSPRAHPYQPCILKYHTLALWPEAKLFRGCPTQNTFALLAEAMGEEQGHPTTPWRAGGACAGVSQQLCCTPCLQAMRPAGTEVPSQCQCCGTAQLPPRRMGGKQVCRETPSAPISCPVSGHKHRCTVTCAGKLVPWTLTQLWSVATPIRTQGLARVRDQRHIGCFGGKENLRVWTSPCLRA